MLRWFPMLPLTFGALLAPLACSRSGGGEVTGPAAEEFEALAERAAWAVAAEEWTGETFFAAVQPFGPLDLVAERCPDARWCNEKRNFFLGVMADNAGIPHEDVEKATNGFHCGRCALERRDRLLARLAAIRRVVRSVNETGASVVAAWPKGGYRFGHAAFSDGEFRRLRPSPVAGFLPWESDPMEGDPDAYFAALNTTRAGVEEIVKEMRRLGICAVVRDASGTRVVLEGGIGDNEAGLVFVAPGGRPPRSGATVGDGRQIYPVPVSEEVYFYVST